MIIYDNTPGPVWLELLLLAVGLVITVLVVSWALGGAYALHMMAMLDPEVLWQMQLVRAGE